VTSGALEELSVPAPLEKTVVLLLRDTNIIRYLNIMLP